jgi:hypothetical protein
MSSLSAMHLSQQHVPDLGKHRLSARRTNVDRPYQLSWPRLLVSTVKFAEAIGRIRVRGVAGPQA